MTSHPSPWTEALPFLVTHWLANLERDKSDSNDSEERQRALERIRDASAEIASAFSSLGAFGTTIHVRATVTCLSGFDAQFLTLISSIGYFRIPLPHRGIRKLGFKRRRTRMLCDGGVPCPLLIWST